MFHALRVAHFNERSGHLGSARLVPPAVGYFSFLSLLYPQPPPSSIFFPPPVFARASTGVGILLFYLACRRIRVCCLVVVEMMSGLDYDVVDNLASALASLQGFFGAVEELSRLCAALASSSACISNADLATVSQASVNFLSFLLTFRAPYLFPLLVN